MFWHLGWASTGWEVAAASLSTTGNRNVGKCEVRAPSTAKYVVVCSIRGCCASDVVESYATDGDAVSWCTSWPTVEVVLLDVDAVVGDAGEFDVLVDDILNLCNC